MQTPFTYTHPRCRDKLRRKINRKSDDMPGTGNSSKDTKTTMETCKNDGCGVKKSENCDGFYLLLFWFSLVFLWDNVCWVFSF